MTERLRAAAQAALNACERIVEQEGRVHFGIDFRVLAKTLSDALVSTPGCAEHIGRPDEQAFMARMEQNRDKLMELARHAGTYANDYQRLHSTLVAYRAALVDMKAAQSTTK